MRKDARRSLLLWPAAASITITAATWIPTQFHADPWVPYRLLDSLTAPPRYFGPQLDSDGVADQMEITSRTERGSRAMQLPPRVAEAFGAATQIVLKAPHRDEQRELAGLVLEAPRESPRSVHELANDILRGDLNAANQIVDTREPERDWGLVQSLRQRQTVAASQGSGPPNSHQATFRAASTLPRSTSSLTQLGIDPTVDIDGDGFDGADDDITSNDSRQVPSALDPFSSARYFPLHVEQSDPEIRDQPSTSQSRHDAVSHPAGWPVTTRLDQQLVELFELAKHSRSTQRDQFVSHVTSESQMAAWSEQVSMQLDALRALPRLGDPAAGDLIEQLSTLANQGEQQAELLNDRQLQSRWLSTVHAVSRRVAVWRLVWEVMRQDNTWGSDLERDDATGDDVERVSAVRRDLVETGDVAGWDRYLLLDEIERAVQSSDRQSRLVLAQRFLARLSWHRLDETQGQWLQRDSVMQLASALRPWAQDAVDYAALMQQIESQESDAIDLSGVNVAGTVQTLRHADHPQATQVAQAIETHYRNANVRIAVRAQLLQRLLPHPETKTVPVNSMILGSHVRGNSQVNTELGIQLVPSPDRWKLCLNTAGNVTTHSTGARSSVAVRTLGQAAYESGTEIEITSADVTISDTQASVNGKTRLRGIETDFDGWPLLGPLMTSIAESQYQRLSPQANRIANRTLQQRIESEVDAQLSQRADRATDQLTDVLLGPLGRLQLDPKVTDMQTSQERLTARFRVAGDWQLAAFTPRPRAPGASLMSVQVHQSAINNTVEQLIPRGEPMRIQELIQQIAHTFAQDHIAPPEDLPEDVTIQFSKTRPITVEIEDDRMWITLRILRLRRADSVDLTQFIVRAAYMPRVDGISAGLVRDGHLRISGPNLSMRERLPVRTIFNKVFSPNREIPVTLPKLREHPAMQGLVVSQLELRDGWLGLAIEAENVPRVADNRAGQRDMNAASSTEDRQRQ